MDFKNITLKQQETNILDDIICYEKINKPLMDLLLISNLLRDDLRYKYVFEPE